VRSHMSTQVFKRLTIHMLLEKRKYSAVFVFLWRVCVCVCVSKMLT